MNIRRLVRVLALCSALALAAGCISYKQHTTFESDGSGRVVMDTWIRYFGDEEAGRAFDEKLTAELKDELDAAFADIKGVQLEEIWAKLEGEGDERREHFRIVLAFDDIEKLNGQDTFENQEITFQNNDNEFLFKQVILNEREEEREEPTEESEYFERTFFEECTFTYTVVMPGRVVDTTGTVGDDGRTVTWEWPLYDFANLEEIKMTAKSQKE